MLNKEQIAALSDEEREIFWRRNYRRGYPRSFAVVLGGLVMAIELDPALALDAAFTLWISLVLLRAVIGPLINRLFFPPNPLGFDAYGLSLVVGMILPFFGS